MSTQGDQVYLRGWIAGKRGDLRDPPADAPLHVVAAYRRGYESGALTVNPPVGKPVVPAKE